MLNTIRQTGATLLVAVVMTFSLVSVPTQQAQSQALRTVTFSTVNGAVNGSLLGGATMALQNEYEPYYLQFGVGMGTLFGLGNGFYDIAAGRGTGGMYIQGTFSSSSTSSTIILLDTIYGAATGAVVGTAINLMRDERLVTGMQYGSGAGAWAGFAFGLVDAYVISSAGDFDDFDDFDDFGAHSTRGMIQWDGGARTQAGFLTPMNYATMQGGQAGPEVTLHAGAELFHLNISL